MRSIKDFGRESEKNESSIKDEVQSVTQKYSGKSEDELLYLLRKNAAEAKKNGTFSADELDSFVAFVSSSLDERSLGRLNALVEMIKKE